MSELSNPNPNIRTVIAPESPVTSGGTPRVTEQEAPELNKTHKRRKRFIAAVSAAALLAGGLGVGAALNSIGEKPAEVPATSETPAEVPATSETNEPPEAPTKSELLPSEMDLTIPAGLSTEDAGRLVIDRYTTWINAGSNNQQLYDEWRESGVEAKDFAPAYAEQFTNELTAALFVKDWATHPDLLKCSEDFTQVNYDALRLNLITGNVEFDEVPYWQILTFESVSDVASGTNDRTIAINYTSSNNSDLNRVGELDGHTQDNTITEDITATITVTLVSDGVEERISAYKIN